MPSVKVVITGHKGGKEDKTYDIKEGETCGQLKKRIADDMSISASRLKLSHRDKNCDDSTAVLTYTGKNNIPIHCAVAKLVNV